MWPLGGLKGQWVSFCGWMKTWSGEFKSEKWGESLRWLTGTSSWHVSIKERISPQIEVVGVPIFHQPSTGCNCWGKGKTEVPHFTPPGRCSGVSPAPFSHFSSVCTNPTAPLRPTPGGTSSTGKTDPFTRSLFFLQEWNIESERLQTCSCALRNLGLVVGLNAKSLGSPELGYSTRRERERERRERELLKK